MTELKFYPGETRMLLEERAHESGMKKAEFLRKLIKEAPERDQVLSDIYAKITEAGSLLKEAAQRGEHERAMSIVRRIKEYGRVMAKYEISDKPSNFSRKEMLASAHGRAMTFRPMEQEEKLRGLSVASGLGMNITLRALVCGYRLPNEMAWRVHSRLSQLGGLIKHLSGGFPESTRKEFWELGVEIGVMASK